MASLGTLHKTIGGPVVVLRTVWKTVRESVREQTLVQRTMMPAQTFQGSMIRLYVGHRVETNLDSKLF